MSRHLGLISWPKPLSSFREWQEEGPGSSLFVPRTCTMLTMSVGGSLYQGLFSFQCPKQCFLHKNVVFWVISLATLFLIITILRSVIWYFIVCTFLITNDVEYLFMYLLATCVNLLGTVSLNLYFRKWSCFLLFIFMSSFWILILFRYIIWGTFPILWVVFEFSW